MCLYLLIVITNNNSLRFKPRLKQLLVTWFFFSRHGWSCALSSIVSIEKFSKCARLSCNGWPSRKRKDIYCTKTREISQLDWHWDQRSATKDWEVFFFTSKDVKTKKLSVKIFVQYINFCFYLWKQLFVIVTKYCIINGGHCCLPVRI